MFEKYSFEVGILEDGPHLDAARGQRGLHGQDVITTYAGGPRRKLAVPRKDSGKTIADVSSDLRKHLGFNFYQKPFENRSSDIIKFTSQFFKMVFKDTAANKKRCENLLQAVVRNPILLGKYKTEGNLTKVIKGFSRPMIDTAQLFKAIKAHCSEKGT